MKKLLITITALFICTSAFAHTINWYVDGSVYQTTTCNSGDSITPPALPSAPYGYGNPKWISIKDVSILGQCRVFYGHTSDGLYKNWVKTTETDEYIDLYKMKIVYQYFTVYGESICSDTPGNTVGAKGNPNNSNGGYCWCHATSLYLADHHYSYPIVQEKWVFAHNYANYKACIPYCANYCARGACFNVDPKIQKQFLDFDDIGIFNE